MQTLVFASNNRHKIDEVNQILSAFGYEVKSMADVGFTDDIDETGNTFKDNAALKANAVFEATGLPCFADDSGLEVDALNGQPGVYSARYAGSHGDTAANNQKLMLEMSGKPNRKARFKTVIAYRTSSGLTFFEGTVNGNITETHSGSNGFGYDPLFIPDGYNITFAEMPSEEKNQISHRRRALDQFVGYLRG
jgi:XTP/dITP diphosphohydrolase